MGRALYWRKPDKKDLESLSAFGIKAEDYTAPTEIVVWADNALSVAVFDNMSQQWRHGFSGPTGLDYAVLPEIWRRLKVPPADRDAVFQDLRVLERAALNEIHRN